MGLIVDVPKPGFGNTNDGNTSRRFFAGPDLAAEITGVGINLIFRFQVILEIEEKKMYCIAPLCIKDVHSSVSFNSANITTPSSYEDKTETA
jgi:hypothetical protein